MSDPIFISHSTKDDAFVAELRQALELRGLTVWVDSRSLRGGDQLAPEIEQAISESRAVLVVVSQHSLNSEWVHDEVDYARRVLRKRGVEPFPIIPLLLPGTTPAALRSFFPRKAIPVAVNIKEGPGALEAAMTDLLAALGERLPTDAGPHEAVAARPVAELLLKLTDPRIIEEAGTRRAAAEAQLIYRPADRSERDVESDRFTFKASYETVQSNIATVKITDKKISFDTKGKDTWKHSKAGSKLVVLSSPVETDFLFKQNKSMGEILDYINMLDAYDIVIVEGAHDKKIPKIRLGNIKERENTMFTYKRDFNELMNIIKNKILRR